MSNVGYYYLFRKMSNVGSQPASSSASANASNTSTAAPNSENEITDEKTPLQLLIMFNDYFKIIYI